jgi:hypothetical protein
MKKQFVSISLFMFLFLIPIMFGCEKDDPKSNLELAAIDISQESDWDLLISEGTEQFIMVRHNNYIPEEVFYKPTDEHDGYLIYFSEDGFPEKIVVDNVIIMMGNFNGNLCDAAVIYNNELEIFREVETDINWDELNLKSGLLVEGRSGFLRKLGLVTSGAACIGSTALALSTGGAAIPLAILGCASYAAHVAEVFVDDDIEVLGVNVAETLGYISTAGTCVNSLFDPSFVHSALCVDKATSLILYHKAEAAELEENQLSIVNLGGAIVTSGNGDVKVTLSWSTNADLDLYVVDPNGEQIYWKNDFSQSGGELDVDDWGETNGRHEENIFWKDGSAPNGTYSVMVHYFDWMQNWRPSSTNYSVYVNAFGDYKIFSKNIKIDELEHITDFDQHGLKSVKIFEFEITKGGDKKEFYGIK